MLVFPRSYLIAGGIQPGALKQEGEMELEWVIANFLKLFFLFTSPVTFLVGIFLIYDIDTYQRIEQFLAKNYGMPKSLVMQLEKNRALLQVHLLKRRRIVGGVCILNSLMAIVISIIQLKKY